MKGYSGGWIVIMVGWVMVVFVGVLVVQDYSGVYINLVVIVVLVVGGKFVWLEVGGYVLVQVFGVVVGVSCVWLIYIQYYCIIKDFVFKLAMFSIIL